MNSVPPSLELRVQEARDAQRACGCRACRVSLIVQDVLADRTLSASEVNVFGVGLYLAAEALIREAVRRRAAETL